MHAVILCRNAQHIYIFLVHALFVPRAKKMKYFFTIYVIYFSYSYPSSRSYKNFIKVSL